MKIVHNLDNSHYGGIQEMIFTLYKFSRHKISFWAADGTMAPEMRAAGMELLTGGPEPWEKYDVLVGHGVGGWSYSQNFDYAHSRGLKTVEVMHSNAVSLTDPDKTDAFVGISPIVDAMNPSMRNRYVIYGPIDTEKFYQRKAANGIGRLSRLVEDKNPKPFVEIARRFPDERFILAGGKIASGENEAYYNHIAAIAPSNLTMVGYVRDFTEFYSHLKLYVYHTRDESCCTSVNMAMAAGVPVICQDLQSLRVTTGGLATFCSTEEQFAEAIGSFLSDPKPFNDTAQMGKIWAKEHAGLEATVGVWDNLVERL